MPKRKNSNKKKQLRKNKAARTRSQKPERHRPTLSESYAPLIAWVAFANGDDLNPGQPPSLERGDPLSKAIFSALCEYRALDREPIREWARGFLREIASAWRKGHRIQEPPPPETRFMIKGNRLVESRGDNASLELIDFLKNHDVDRVRICLVCDKLFVALNDRSRTCGAVCSNRKSTRAFYSKNREAVQQRNLAAYWEGKLRKNRLKNFLREKAERRAMLSPSA